MEIAELAKQITILLAPTMPDLQRVQGKTSEEVSESLRTDSLESVQELWQRLRPRLEGRASAMDAVADLVSEPDNPDVQAAFRVQLRKILIDDPALASDLAGFLEKTPLVQPVNYAVNTGSGSIAQRRGVAAGAGGVAVGRDAGNIHVVYAGEGAKVFTGEAPVKMTAVDRDTALGRYLQHVISRNRYLQLQGIRSGGRLVHIELDRIYIRLRATQQRLVAAEERWLTEEQTLAPGERARLASQAPVTTETVTVSVEKALSSHPRLVVLGDPGSGKTTLLRYLALLYARDLAENSYQVQARLGSAEPRRLPILLPLRQIGQFLQSRPDEGTEGHARLLEFLLAALASERIELPGDFFDPWLTQGEAVILLDGLDEVANPDLRRRVSRLVEGFTQAYERCRYVVTSRIVGYTGPARLGESYAVTTVRDFTRDDIEQFLGNWHRLIAVGQLGEGESTLAYASEQTRHLLQAIDSNPRIRDLAINPLLLTVIAMVHRDRVKLPDRRAELYAEAIDVLLGKWEEAKGVQESPILSDGQPFDTGDRRLLLQDLALHLHERKQKDIEIADLRCFLRARFKELVREAHTVERVIDRFLAMIEERTGLLVARGEGVYAFSHLTFQEYLAALGVGARDDYVAYTLQRAPDPWWREVILLEAGYLSTQSTERTTGLIRAIAEQKQEPEPYRNLVLAAECLRDVGASRVGGNLQHEVQQRLRKNLEAPPPILVRWFKKVGVKAWIEQRARAMEALVRTGAGFWTMPYGEPEWVEISAGEFWMGSGDTVHRVKLDAYLMARVPITNAQYHLFTQVTGYKAPEHWQEDRPPKGLESHPVVNVSWGGALAYCQWLSQVTGRPITLPSEAQWEKAARGDKDKREYPWGDTFEATRCNNSALGLYETTPVGIFPEGASPYGCLDMAGNVWEWTRSRWGDYPYPEEGPERQAREDLAAADRRVLRGGAFDGDPEYVRCASRSVYLPDSRYYVVGFRVVVSPFFSGR